MIEEWKDVVDYENLYSVSNFGNVKGYKKNILKPDNSNGYSKLALYWNGKFNKYYIHRLVAIAFIPNPNNLPQVNHIDGNKLNNHVNNLEWVSIIENMSHFYKNNTKSSKYLGVHLNVTKKYWVAEIGINNKNIFLGQYKTEEEAYQARIQYEKDNNIINKYS